MNLQTRIEKLEARQRERAVRGGPLTAPHVSAFADSGGAVYYCHENPSDLPPGPFGWIEWGLDHEWSELVYRDRATCPDAAACVAAPTCRASVEVAAEINRYLAEV